jgi:hypothetical protein
MKAGAEFFHEKVMNAGVCDRLTSVDTAHRSAVRLVGIADAKGGKLR